jgi:saccharopine dehydrogenase (NADP+, L-glutamate forming)
MARFVGITCGIAARLLLDHHPTIDLPGVLAPYMKEICDPIREKLKREGIKVVERVL